MKFFYIVCSILFAHTISAQSPDSLALSNFSDAVLELSNSELVRNGTLSVSVRAISTGKNIFALNQEQSLPSASILKLVTTATALSVFGGDYRFQTFLEYDGTIRKDTLVGNLYLRGTGDPSLGSDRFKEYPNSAKLLTRWTAAVQKAGIKHIKGDVIGDASYFNSRSVADSWIWGDLGNYFGAGVQGLNFSENQYRVRFKPGVNTDDPAPVTGTEPSMPYLSFTNQVLTGEKGTGDQVNIYADPLGTNVVLTGTVPKGFTTFSVKGSVPDAAGYAAHALRQNLMSSFVTIDKPLTPTEPPKPSPVVRRQLDEYKSPPLRELTQQTNFLSINLYADAFLKQIGKKLVTKSDYEASCKALADYWLNRRVDMRGFYIKDGSGLSPSGSLTTANMTGILSAVSKETSFPDFYKSIAILGQTGTVKNYGKGTRAAGNIRAKSGSIEGTRAYAGYVTSRSGAIFSFAIIAHKYLPESGRTVTEELVRLMVLMAEL